MLLSRHVLRAALLLAALAVSVRTQAVGAAEEGLEADFSLGEKKTGDYTLCQDIAQEIRKKGAMLYYKKDGNPATPVPTPANWAPHLRDDFILRNDKGIMVGWKSLPQKSCMSCAPAQQRCPVGCQDLIDHLYWACDGSKLSFGDYYDPPMQISGNWDQAKPKLNIAISKCGCNGAPRGQLLAASAAAIAALAAVLVQAAWLV